MEGPAFVQAQGSHARDHHPVAYGLGDGDFAVEGKLQHHKHAGRQEAVRYGQPAAANAGAFPFPPETGEEMPVYSPKQYTTIDLFIQDTIGGHARALGCKGFFLDCYIIS